MSTMEMSFSANSHGPAVTCLGAAQAVTGSMHLAEVGGRRVLLDCGLFLGSRFEARERNLDFPFAPSSLDAVVLSHAHLDHCGNLPNLVRQGFDGPIYCTPATRDLVDVMLTDAARIYEEDALLQTVLGPTTAEGVPPLYTRQDVAQTLAQCVPLPYDRSCDLFDDVQLRLLDAGHLLGSAVSVLTTEHAGRAWTLAYTGDLGRYGVPFLRPPAPAPAADLLLCECTYGGRSHETLEHMAHTLATVLTRTAERGGKVLIPAFSLGRSQLVLHFLCRWMAEERLPRLALFMDSPLAADIVEVYRRYPEGLADPDLPELRTQPGADGAPLIRHIYSAEDSRRLSVRREPCVIVASGGMCETGRILTHLQQHIDDPRCTIVLVSYQAAQSLGRRLLERGPTVKFLGRAWNKWADVVELKGFSGHADQNDLLTYLTPLAERGTRLRLVHGDVHQGEALARTLRARGVADVAMPHRGERETLQ
jgi:metallo-beta-lactamase family protein